MSSFRHILIALVFVLLAASCKPGTPSGVISESKMESILYDYHLAQAAAESGEGDVVNNRYLYVHAVFDKYGITEEEFDSSMVWYSANADILFKMYTRLNARFEAESKGMGVGVSDTELYANMSEIGDTANIWSGSRFLILENNRLHNLVTLSMVADSTFLAGDTYKLSFASHFFGDTRRDAFAFLHVKFKDGRVSSVFQHVSSSYDVMMSLQKPEDFLDAETERITITFFLPLVKDAAEASYFYIVNPALLRIHQKAKLEETLPVDSLAVDSIDVNGTDSLQHDSISVDTIKYRRLSPDEFKGSKQVDKKIEIVKEKPIVIPRRNGRKPLRRR